MKKILISDPEKAEAVEADRRVWISILRSLTLLYRHFRRPQVFYHSYVANIIYSQYAFLISVNKATVMSFAITEALAQFSSKLSKPLCSAVSVMQRIERKGIRFT